MSDSRTDVSANSQPKTNSTNHKHSKIIEGSEIVQSYEDLLNEAERILGELCKLGLKPQDKVIFQINQNCDFIPAFWGCILGNFVPVSISENLSFDDEA